MSHTLKQNNKHAAHPVYCSECERALPKRAYRDRCATCIKREQRQGAEYVGKGGAA